MLKMICNRVAKWWCADATWQWCLNDEGVWFTNGEIVIGTACAIVGAMTLIAFFNLCALILG